MKSQWENQDKKFICIITVHEMKLAYIVYDDKVKMFHFLILFRLSVSNVHFIGYRTLL